MNAYAERFVRSIKSECPDRMILLGRSSLEHVTTEYGLTTIESERIVGSETS